jgi:hypothetical protein
MSSTMIPTFKLPEEEMMKNLILAAEQFEHGFC